MKSCKNIPSNKRYKEGSIAVSYGAQEFVVNAMEFMPNASSGNHKATWEAFLQPDSEFSDVGPMLKDKKFTLTSIQFVQIRRWVLFKINPPGLDEFYRYAFTVYYIVTFSSNFDFRNKENDF